MHDLVARAPLDRRGLFVLLVLMMLAVAIGHLFVIQDFTTLHFGVPLWLWLHILVVGVLLALAWIATGLMVERGS